MSDKVVVDKLQAARDQIRAAILIWAQNDNPVAVHTLIAAGHEIVHALYNRAGLQDLLLDSDKITEEGLPKWRGLVRARANFFKHADRDPDATIEISSEMNEIHILFTLVGLHRMGVKLEPLENSFLNWLELHRPELMKEGLQSKQFSQDSIQRMRGLSRQQFLDELVPLWRRRQG